MQFLAQGDPSRVLDLARIKGWFDELLAPTAGVQTSIGVPPELESPPSHPIPAQTVPVQTWHAARLELAEQLWGEGFVMPGGAAEVLHLAGPIGLSGADTLLLLGAGPFGAARTIVTARQCWVEGYERDPDLAELARHRAEEAGLRKRAPTSDLHETTKFRPRSASQGLSLFAIPDQPSVRPVLAGAAVAMRPGGQLGMIELVAADDLSDVSGAHWRRLERRTEALPAKTAIDLALREHSFDVRIVEDISSRHVQAVLMGWMKHLEAVAADKRNGRPPPQDLVRLMVAEAELWLLRLRLINAGRLNLIRWQAIRR